jgi:hypothetical protein
MGIPIAGGGTLTTAELDQDRRGSRTALRYVSVGQKALPALAYSSVEQSYRHLNDQLADCCANALPPVSPGATLTRNADRGPRLLVSPGLGASCCRTYVRRAADSVGYVADLTHSCAGSEDYGV